jgi:N-dimethylarginine dimethylaminohydrolase
MGRCVRPGELQWGRRYLMVRPDHFRVEYAINPYMRLEAQPHPTRAARQWRSLLAAVRTAGATVEVLPQPADCPDMVYAMNLGLALAAADGSEVVMSHMRHHERRAESSTAANWFIRQGRRPMYLGRDGVGPHFESGDAFPFADSLVVGFGPRTDELAMKHLAAAFDVTVRGLRLTHPGMYHLDLAFCPLDQDRAIVCPAAFDDDSARAVMQLVPEPLVLTESEALTFAANSVVIGRRILMPACPSRVRCTLESWGFDVVVVDVSEFHKGGGSIRCLTNPLDVMIGRDLPAGRPGGEVLLASRRSDTYFPPSDTYSSEVGASAAAAQGAITTVAG